MTELQSELAALAAQLTKTQQSATEADNQVRLLGGEKQALEARLDELEKEAALGQVGGNKRQRQVGENQENEVPPGDA